MRTKVAEALELQMIAKYSNLCRVCHDRIPAGEDVSYDADAKTIAHWTCLENEPPDEKSYRLASELGFIGPMDKPNYAEWRLWRNQPGNGRLF